ncbi:hypothetical protein M441DRAFT_85771 [Trichoderma asperellum CBS 433.97]|uniref:Uncharacterized protein n=1 Tax=Trichoderma asperellum (strain ATCC 204424 / CBS 433.97 / NBRC 101777) TaxID=1042311 RepID=A0A2T3ZPQ4_TRIA4|nr:hypothetical protein M441DRAFT_85771 [Trichoderma asperellum CBS 433.97]PTB46782.1 hypothetical protein M441DRAFT_85771 [Trichoderma asperellum CBS 433.97]
MLPEISIRTQKHSRQRRSNARTKQAQSRGRSIAEWDEEKAGYTRYCTDILASQASHPAQSAAGRSSAGSDEGQEWERRTGTQQWPVGSWPTCSVPPQLPSTSTAVVRATSTSTRATAATQRQAHVLCTTKRSTIQHSQSQYFAGTHRNLSESSVDKVRPALWRQSCELVAWAPRAKSLPATLIRQTAMPGACDWLRCCHLSPASSPCRLAEMSQSRSPGGLLAGIAPCVVLALQSVGPAAPAASCTSQHFVTAAKLRCGAKSARFDRSSARRKNEQSRTTSFSGRFDSYGCLTDGNEISHLPKSAEFGAASPRQREEICCGPRQ